MLQQTRAAAVVPYYLRFLQELPTIADLAAAKEEKVLKLWEGLGYYSRARNLQRAAQVILREHGGVFPRGIKEIRALPGIGAYTAGAIAAICFNQPEPAVDGNVLRVLTRLAVRKIPPRLSAWRCGGRWKAVCGAAILLMTAMGLNRG